MKEIWKDITGYEGLYQISNMGRVKALPKVLKNGVGYAVRKGKILSPSKKENNYLSVGLTKGQSTKNFYIHRLVGIHFIPNPENKPDVNHIRSNKSDNRYFRLEWATKSENLLHSFKEGTHKPMNGTISPAAKLNDEMVREIKSRYVFKKSYERGGISIRHLANEYGVHHSVIDGIVKGKRWKHIILKVA